MDTEQEEKHDWCIDLQIPKKPQVEGTTLLRWGIRSTQNCLIDSAVARYPDPKDGQQE